MTQRSRAEILEEVDDLATEVMKHAPDMDEAEARALVWEEADGIFEEYRQAPEEASPEPVTKSAEYRVEDAVMEAVTNRANQVAWTEWPTRSIEAVRADLWETVEGGQLYKLLREKGQEPYWQARLAKSAHHRDAWQILEEWRSG